MLVAALLLVTGTAAAATAPTGRPQASASAPSPAPSAASQAAALAQMTGLNPGQVTTRATCGAPAPGQATCDAHMVVLRSTGAPVRPRLHTQHALADVQAGRRSGPIEPPGTGGTASAADAVPAGQTAPAAGTPAWLQQAYDLSYLAANAGGNQTIGIIDAYADKSAESDLAVFRAAYGLPPCTTANGCFTKVNENGASSPLPSTATGWAQEQALDLDAVSSLCPNCHIILVEANSGGASDLSTAMTTAVALGATVLSDSWTIPSAKPLTQQLTWPTVATVAAAGDNGYDNHLSGKSGDVYPAAAVGVTAVGGTSLDPATGLRGYGETAWLDGGSGCDLAEKPPAYQPVMGCTGRAYDDVSADADPLSGLSVYDTSSGGWTVLGGTSLATPLVAAFDAISGVDGSSPQWAYQAEAKGLLNDPVSGSNGSCATTISYICAAGLGYDGPTGAGSISGQVAFGGPGIGGPAQTDSAGALSYTQSVTDASAALTGGVYPNGYDTTYSWQYGTTTSYGQETTPAPIAAGTAPVAVADTLAGLSPSTTYHYRLVASNSLGTTYGYDYTLTTASPPALPQESGTNSATTAQNQSTTTTSSATQTPSGDTTPVDTTTTATTPTVTAPVATTPTPLVTPVATSPAAGVSRVRPAAPVIIARPRLGGAARVGATLRVTGGIVRNGTVTAVRFVRCARTCVTTGRGHGAAHRVTAVDAGYDVRAWVTVSGAGGTVSTWASGTIGPVRSSAAGSASLRPGAATIRGTARRALARVTTRRSRARGATVERAWVGAVHGAVRVWAYIVTRAGVMSCTVPVTVRRSVTLSFTLRAGQRAVLVAVGRG